MKLACGNFRVANELARRDRASQHRWSEAEAIWGVRELRSATGKAWLLLPTIRFHPAIGLAGKSSIR